MCSGRCCCNKATSKTKSSLQEVKAARKGSTRTAEAEADKLRAEMEKELEQEFAKQQRQVSAGSETEAQETERRPSVKI